MKAMLRSVKTFTSVRGVRRSGGLRPVVGAGVWVLALWQTPALAVDTLRCGSRLVSVEALAEEVTAICGEPAYRDQQLQSLPNGYGSDSEVWYYNFGPSQLLRLLTFRNGRLTDIRSDGYGFYASTDGHCAPAEIVSGISKYRLLVECGEPSSRRAQALLQPLSAEPGYYGYNNGAVTQVYREEWIYNFGPSYFLRKVTLLNGRVSDVEDGDRGFDLP